MPASGLNPYFQQQWTRWTSLDEWTRGCDMDKGSHWRLQSGPKQVRKLVHQAKKAFSSSNWLSWGTLQTCLHTILCQPHWLLVGQGESPWQFLTEAKRGSTSFYAHWFLHSTDPLIFLWVPSVWKWLSVYSLVISISMQGVVLTRFVYISFTSKGQLHTANTDVTRKA